ncbi:hypothetical protein LEMLEM_LOCUS11019, partial [Lemmus lemmus]
QEHLQVNQQGKDKKWAPSRGSQVPQPTASERTSRGLTGKLTQVHPGPQVTRLAEVSPQGRWDSACLPSFLPRATPQGICMLE